MRRTLFSTLLAAAVLAIIVGPVGTAVFWLGFVHGDSPCVLCWAQRTAMLLVALLGLFVLRYGPRPRYLGLAVLLAGWGVFMAVRHSAAHVVRDVGQGFSVAIFGAHTYIWSAAIFWCVVMAMGGLLLLVLRDDEPRGDQRPWGGLERFTAWAFVVVVAGNLVQAFASTGPPPYMGQSDPVRFSFNPRHWVWSLEEWHPAPISVRGRWAISRPSLPGLDPDPARGPFGPLPALPVRAERSLALRLDGPISDLAYDATRDRFALTTDRGVHLADGALASVQRHTVVDTAFAVDLDGFAGVAFLDPATVLALSANKSYVVLREHGTADPVANFRFFVEAPEAFEQLARSRFATVRARMMYASSVAYDASTDAIYTVTVPNERVRALVVSRFARRDMTLSAEFVPSVGAGLALGERRALDEFHVTGATVIGSRLVAISAAFSTLLVIDLPSQSVVAAYGIAGVRAPVGVALRQEDLHVVDGAGTLWTLPAPPGVLPGR